VDDNQAVLALVVTILERADFRVLSADSGPGALQLAAETTGIIHLLLSDVDMPTLSGPDLASALRRARPDMRVMFMSGGDNGKGVYPEAVCAGEPGPDGHERIARPRSVTRRRPEI
jgi:CheY-like chemotaxis protein